MTCRSRPQSYGLTAVTVVLAAVALNGCGLAEELSEEAVASPTPASGVQTVTKGTQSPDEGEPSSSVPTPAEVSQTAAEPSPAATTPAATDPTVQPTFGSRPGADPPSTAQPVDPSGPRLATLRSGDFFVDDTRLKVRSACRTGSSSFELFLEDGSRFYFDLLRDGSAITDAFIFDPVRFEDIRQVSLLDGNEGEPPRVRVAGVEMRSDAGYTFEVAFLVNTGGRRYCGQ